MPKTNFIRPPGQFLTLVAALIFFFTSTNISFADEDFGDWTIIIRHAAVLQKPEDFEGTWDFPISKFGEHAVYDTFLSNFGCRTNRAPDIHVFGRDLPRFRQTGESISQYFFENCEETPEPGFDRIVTEIDPRNPSDKAIDELVAEIESYIGDGDHIWVFSGQIIAKLSGHIKEFGGNLPIVQSDDARCRLYFSYWEWRRSENKKQSIRRFPIPYACKPGDEGCPRCSPIRQ